MTETFEPTLDDPRFGLATAAEALGQLIDATEAQVSSGIMQRPTPCPEYDVEALLDHVVMVVRRIAAIGNGEHFSTVEADSPGSDWSKHFKVAAHEIMEAWTDDAKLERMFEVPWGEFPGAPILFTYTGELAVHAWDLATATEQPLSIPDEALGGALFASKFIPAQGRDAPELPFGEVVEVSPDAPVVLQIAGWLGRQVHDH